MRFLASDSGSLSKAWGFPHLILKFPRLAPVGPDLTTQFRNCARLKPWDRTERPNILKCFRRRTSFLKARVFPFGAARVPIGSFVFSDSALGVFRLGPDRFPIVLLHFLIRPFAFSDSRVPIRTSSVIETFGGGLAALARRGTGAAGHHSRGRALAILAVSHSFDGRIHCGYNFHAASNRDSDIPKGWEFPTGTRLEFQSPLQALCLHFDATPGPKHRLHVQDFVFGSGAASSFMVLLAGYRKLACKNSFPLICVATWLAQSVPD